MSKMMTLQEAISQVKNRTTLVDGKPMLVQDWRSQIPAWSKWFPGCPGDPTCGKCLGTGYVTLEVPIDHALFGKIVFCDCVSQRVLTQHELYQAEKGK